MNNNLTNKPQPDESTFHVHRMTAGPRAPRGSKLLLDMSHGNLEQLEGRVVGDLSLYVSGRLLGLDRLLHGGGVLVERQQLLGDQRGQLPSDPGRG